VDARCNNYDQWKKERKKKDYTKKNTRGKKIMLSRMNKLVRINEEVTRSRTNVKVDSKNYLSSFSLLIHLGYVAKKIIGLTISWTRKWKISRYWCLRESRTRSIAEKACELAYRRQSLAYAFLFTSWQRRRRRRRSKVEIPDGDWLSRKISRDKLSLKWPPDPGLGEPLRLLSSYEAPASDFPSQWCGVPSNSFLSWPVHYAQLTFANFLQ